MCIDAPRVALLFVFVLAADIFVIACFTLIVKPLSKMAGGCCGRYGRCRETIRRMLQRVLLVMLLLLLGLLLLLLMLLGSVIQVYELLLVLLLHLLLLLLLLW